MVESMDFERQKTRYCIRGKHVVIICVTVVVCSVAVGLGVGLSRSDTSPTPTKEPPNPTTGPQPPPAGRGPCKASNNTDGGWRNFRLPSYVKPIHYDLHLEPDLTTDLYTGSVSIHLEISEPTRHIWLHIRETFVSSVPRLLLKTQAGQSDVAVEGCFEYRPQEYVVVEATTELAVTNPGEVYVLTLDFQGWLNGSLVGFYRVTYTEGGDTK